MAGNDIPRGRRRICKSGGRRWGRGEGGRGSRVIFHAELMDAASFSSPRYFWPAFHDRDANLFQFCCRGTRTRNDHPWIFYKRNAATLLVSRNSFEYLYIVPRKIILHGLVIIFCTNFKVQSKWSYRARIFAVEYDVRALTVSLFVKLELCWYCAKIFRSSFDLLY